MLPKLNSLQLRTPEDFEKQAKISFGEKPASKAQPENDANQKQQQAKQPKAERRRTRLTWTKSSHHYQFKQLEPPHWLREHSNDTEVSNFIYTALSCFLSATISRPNPTYTWLDIIVPDQLKDRLGSHKLTIDGTTEGKIFIYR